MIASSDGRRSAGVSSRDTLLIALAEHAELSARSAWAETLRNSDLALAQVARPAAGYRQEFLRRVSAVA